MFEKLGRRIDNLIVDISYWLSYWHRKRFWYKLYAYFFFLKRKNEENYDGALERAYKEGYLYKWQYKRLKRLKVNKK